MSHELAKRFGPMHKPYVPANRDAEGYPEAEKAGLKHVAVRSSGRDSTYKPATGHVAPRPAAWSPTAGPS
ncbi:hypothetical protein D9Q98_009876 [Chlorella vulgaris]|uniref:Uncharacterized protein n=1 Tax=Chlorella vulgaris TaxID=3077 RepID=A0A9D4TFP5_CHLVU|nr:hypothetical protein D9Q98_009876 [Chlorella vulgaris]